MMCPMRTVTVVEAPTSAGGYAPGQEDGPRALLEAGLVERLEAAGVAVHRGGRVTPFRWRPDPDNPTAANAGAVIDRAGQVAALVRSAPAEDTIVVLGGDCTVGVGTVAGLRHRGERLGVVYVDRHADLNVPDSTVDGALDWMGVAHMLDIDGAVDGLAALAGHRPMLSSGQISFLGLGPHTDFEAEVISDRGLPVVDVQSAASDPLAKCTSGALSPFGLRRFGRALRRRPRRLSRRAAGGEHRSRHRPIADGVRRDAQRAAHRRTCARAHRDRVQPPPWISGREHNPTPPRDPRELPRLISMGPCRIHEPSAASG